MAKTINQAPIIFLRIAWMEDYQGVTELDIPKGAGTYVSENADGGEVYNFKKINGKYFGYAAIQKGRSIDLSNLGAPKGTQKLNGVTVVFFAKNPTYGSQYIVGWYKNATLYSNLSTSSVNSRGHWNHYLASCKVSEGTLLPIKNRTFEVKGAGQTNLWYPKNYLSSKDLELLFSYIENPTLPMQTKKGNTFAKGWQVDTDLRKSIEISAMVAVASYFEDRGFTIVDVHKENKGWDLEACKGAKVLQLEVKGTQYDFNTIELTPNEYMQLKKNKKTYRLCIVSNSLDAKTRIVDVFYNEGKRWINEKFQIINFSEFVSARVSLM